MVKFEVKAGQIERPAGLLAVQLFGGHKIFKILVIRKNLESVFRSLYEVSPLLKRSDDCQHLLIVDLIIPLDRG